MHRTQIITKSQNYIRLYSVIMKRWDGLTLKMEYLSKEQPGFIYVNDFEAIKVIKISFFDVHCLG